MKRINNLFTLGLITIAGYGLVNLYQQPKAQRVHKQQRTPKPNTAKGNNAAQTQLPLIVGNGFCGAKNPSGFVLPSLRTYLRRQFSEPHHTELLRRLTRESLLDFVESEPDQIPEFKLHLLWTLVEQSEGNFQAGYQAISDARDLKPDDPELAYFHAKLGQKLLQSSDAVESYTTYLQTYPQDVQTKEQLERLKVHQAITANYQRITDNGISLLFPEEGSDFSGHTLLVQQWLGQASELVGGQALSELSVVIYPSRSELLATTCAPMWAGGIFDGIVRVVSSTDEIGFGKLIKHELLHAQLQYTLPQGAPAWFHEGLAQYFAQQIPQPDIWRERMVQFTTWMPFESLQKGFTEFESETDKQLAYRQSALMIDWVIDQQGDDAIINGIKFLSQGGSRKKLLRTLLNSETITGDDFIEYLIESSNE